MELQNKNESVDLQDHLFFFLLSPPPHLPCVLGIYFYINFVPGEYFNGLLDFRKPTIKMSPT